MGKIRLAFMGSPDLGAPCLRALHEAEDMDLLLTVTMGDRRRSRRGGLEPTPVGQAALDLAIPLLRWEKGGGSAVERALDELALDAIVVIAFARLLPPSLLAIPKLGCLNLHASLLPWGRGASPIQQAIIEGLSSSGWTAMLMDEGLDTGPVLARDELTLGERWTSGELYGTLMERAPAFLLRTLRAWQAGHLKPEPQNESAATMTRRIKTGAGAIDWDLSARELDARIRAYQPVPSTWCRREGERLRILAARPSPGKPGARPGEVLAAGPELCVACADGALDLLRLQPAGGRPLAAADYLNGKPLSPGSVLENG